MQSNLFYSVLRKSFTTSQHTPTSHFVRILPHNISSRCVSSIFKGENGNYTLKNNYTHQTSLFRTQNLVNLSRTYASKNNKTSNNNKKEATPAPKAKTTGGSTKYVMHLKGITKTVGEGRVLFQDLDLAVFEGAKIGVLGANGSGKSSLLKLIAGEDFEYDGELKVYNGVTIGYLAQEPELDEEKTVKENILESVSEKKAVLDEYLDLTKKLENRNNNNESDDEKLTDAQWTALEARHKKLAAQVESEKLFDLNRKIERAIDALRCPPGDSSVVDLSGGERRRVALARLLIANPDVLLLDEPTNHLDAESVAWLERYLSEFRGTVMAITHDRYFLDNVAKWILEIDKGSAYPFQGNYTAWLEAKALRMEREAKQEEGRKRLMAQELAWIRSGAKARQAKNKSRIAAFQRLVDQSNESQAARARASNAGGSIIIKPGPRLGDVVIKAQGLSKAIEGRTLFSNLSFELPPGAIVGVIGANGSGKSTLFNIMAGLTEPDEGTVKIGSTVKMALVAQVRADQLTGDHTVYEEVAEGQDTIVMGEGPQQISMQTRAYLAAFNFRGTSQSKLVSGLSGGERNRVQLAKMLKRGCNLLLLDEPTNDLDVDVLRSLENALQEFPGCAVVISHDRYFLDRLCTHILAFEGDSYVHFYPGNYSEYDEDKRRRLGGKYVEPGRIRFKKIETV